MKSDVDNLQRDVADHSISVTALFQKAIVLASKLGDDGFVAWARQELKGYTRGDKEVEYRCLKGQYVVLMPDNRKLPIQWTSSVSGMNTRFITTPLAEMESIAGSDAESFAVKISMDSQLATSLRLQPGDSIGFEIGQTTVAGFLQEIRNRVLDWTLRLTTRTEGTVPLVPTSLKSKCASLMVTCADYGL